MICRDRDLDTENAGFEAREYVLQNWRADVIALAAPDGDLLERVAYDPYGIPFATHPTDLTFGATSGVSGYGMPNGTVNGDDYTYFLALYAASDWRADWNRDGTLSSADNTAFLADYGAATGSWGRGVLSNRSNILGYAGYVHDPATGAAGSGHGTFYHCRLRVHHAGLGRWIQRDPPQFEYGEGPSLYWYTANRPITMADWLGGPMCPGGNPNLGYCPSDPGQPVAPAKPRYRYPRDPWPADPDPIRPILPPHWRPFWPRPPAFPCEIAQRGDGTRCGDACENGNPAAAAVCESGPGVTPTKYCCLCVDRILEVEPPGINWDGYAEVLACLALKEACHLADPCPNPNPNEACEECKCLAYSAVCFDAAHSRCTSAECREYVDNWRRRNQQLRDHWCSQCTGEPAGR